MKKLAFTLLTILSFLCFSNIIRAEEKLYKYRIEYYYDNVLEEKSTIYKNGTYASLITDFETKNRDGYSFSHSSVDDAGMTITDDENANVIKVFYEKKEKTEAVSKDIQTENMDAILKLKEKLQPIFQFFKVLLFH